MEADAGLPAWNGGPAEQRAVRLDDAVAWIVRRSPLTGRAWKFFLLAFVLLAFSSPVPAQSGDIAYIYDELGRLVAVVNPAGETAVYTYDAVGNILSISRRSSALVSIVDFSPKSGPVGTSVTIHGTGFSATPSENAVTFNGVAASVTLSTPTRIDTAVPSGATTGPIRVTTPGGSDTSGAPFTVTTGPPTLTRFSPTIGTTGTPVTLTGTNFDTTPANNEVEFNSVRSSVSSSTPTTIVTSVPSGARSGPISVRTPSGSVSRGDFFVPPSPYTAADVEFTGRTTLGFSRTVVITVPNKIGLLLIDAVAGQRVSLKVDRITIPPQTDIGIYRPDGTSLTGCVVGAGGGYCPITTLPVAGTYTIVVDPRGLNTGSITVTLLDASDVAATITPGGPPVMVVITIPGQMAQVTFTGAVGQRVSVRLTDPTIPATFVDVFRPDGQVLGGIFMSSEGFIDTMTLPLAGTYRIEVRPRLNGVGSIVITLYDVPPDVTGSISAGGPPLPLTITTPGQNARITFSGTAGQRVSLNISSVTVGGSQVSILKPDNTPFVSPTSLTTSGLFIDPPNLPVTGTYTIFIDPFRALVGSMTLTLADEPPDVLYDITPGGPPVVVTTTTPRQNARLTFNGTGRRVSLVASDVTIPTSFVAIGLNPRTLVNRIGAFIEPVSTSGQAYTILVDPVESDTGSMTLTLYDVPADVTGNISTGGPPVPVELTAAGQNASLTFNGTQGQRVGVFVTDVTIPVSRVSFRGPGQFVVEPVTLATGGGFVESPALPSTGSYTILVDPHGTNTGRMTLNLVAIAPDAVGPIAVGGAPVGVEIASAGQNARLTFSGVAGQRLGLTVSGVTIPLSDISILKPDGTPVVSPTRADPSGRFIDSVLPAAGVYTILVDPTAANTGNMTLALAEIPPDVTGSITPGGAPVEVDVGIAGQNARVTFAGTAGQRVSLTLSGVSIVQSEVSILRPNGAPMVYPISVNTSGRFIDPQGLAATGTYTILIDPLGSSTGRVTLALADVPLEAEGTISAVGSSVTVTITTPAQNAELNFPGTEGQRISLGITDVTLGDSWCCGSRVHIRKPDGTILISTWAGTSFGWLETDLPVTGTYKVQVVPEGSNTGSMTLTLSATVTDSISIGGSPVTVANTRAGQHARLTFSGTAGQRVSLGITDVTLGDSWCCGSSVFIRKPDGTIIGQTWAGRSFGWLEAGLPETANYALFVRPESTNTGSITFTLSETANGPIVIGGASVAASITRTGQNIRLTFSGTAGQRLSVAYSGVTIGTSPCCGARLQIRRPDGTVLAGRSVGRDNGQLNAPSLPVNGTYAVLVEPERTNTGSITLRLFLSL